MSTTIIEVVQIEEVVPHPRADRLAIAKIRGINVVVPLHTYRAGDRAVYFPPDILLPPKSVEELGVENYLKHAVYPGNTEKTRCRVAAARLRGVPSFGFLAPLREGETWIAAGEDATALYSGMKYEPPPRNDAGEAIADHPAFHRYTNIENYYRQPDLIPDGAEVRVTEKIHGSNCRVGLIRVGGDAFEFMAGSNRLRREKSESSIYWRPLESESLLRLLTTLCAEEHNVVVFGELYGMQDMDYGVPKGQTGFRVFDITVDGVYLNWLDLNGLCKLYHIDTVPVIYEGPFCRHQLELLTHGPTTIAVPRCKFKGREGVVITPVVEMLDVLGNRVIQKCVSADYLAREGGTDDE